MRSAPQPVRKISRTAGASERQTNRQRAAAANRILKRLYPNDRVFLDYGTPWELLVAVILSAQCTDAQVNKVTKQLFATYPTLESYATARQSTLERAIYSTGFYRTKARHLIATARIVRDRFNGVVPRTMEELVTLPGVARKTANIILQSIYGVSVGIPVDTHVARFARVYGFSTSRDPVKIEQDLMRVFPQRSWIHLGYRIVSYGREHCPARKHMHAACPLVVAGIAPQ